MEDKDFYRYFNNALERLEILGSPSGASWKWINKIDPPLAERLDKGMEIIEALWKNKNYGRYCEAVNLWESLWMGVINRKIKQEEEIVL